MVSLVTVAVVALAIFFICLLLYALVSERRRREGLERASLEMGFTYTPKAAIELPDMELFEKGHSKKKKNLLTATRNDIKWSLFDYQFSSGRSAQHQTVVMAQVDRELPKFSLSRRHFYHKFGKIAGFKEIIFDEYPEFSQEYYLKGEDETAIRQLFTSHVILTITNQPLENHVEAKGNFIIMYTPNIQIKPENLYKFFQEALIIINLFRESDDLFERKEW